MVLIHALVQGRIICSTLTKITPDHTQPAFELKVGPRARFRGLRIVIGETGEELQLPPEIQEPIIGLLTVEDLLATPGRSSWVKGSCYIDGEQEGLLPATILDLICRDYLGRPAEPSLVTEGLIMLASNEGYDGFRLKLLASIDYEHRIRSFIQIPGAIFSSAGVLACAAGDFTTVAPKIYTINLDSETLMHDDDPTFAKEVHRSIRNTDPDPETIDQYVSKLSAGISRLDLIKEIARGNVDPI